MVDDDVILSRASIYAPPTPTVLRWETVLEKLEYITWNTLGFDIHLPNEEISECSSRDAKSGKEILRGLFIIYAEDKRLTCTCMVIKWIDYTLSQRISPCLRFPNHQMEGANWIWITLAINILIASARQFICKARSYGLHSILLRLLTYLVRDYH